MRWDEEGRVTEIFCSLEKRSHRVVVSARLPLLLWKRRMRVRLLRLGYIDVCKAKATTLRIYVAGREKNDFFFSIVARCWLLIEIEKSRADWLIAAKHGKRAQNERNEAHLTQRGQSTKCVVQWTLLLAWDTCQFTPNQFLGMSIINQITRSWNKKALSGV